VLRHDFRVVAPIELAGNGEAREPSDFGDSASLQKVERVAACADEHKPSENFARGLANLVTE
jgi:hypothetical protein